MAWNRPTLPEVIARVENDFSLKFYGTAAPLRRAVIKVLARVWAGAVYLLHLYQAWRYDQGFVHLADADQLPRHGQEVGVYQKAATYAEGLARFTGDPLTPIPQGTRIQIPETRAEYQTTADGTTNASGVGLVLVTALEPGAAGNTPYPTEMELVSPVDGIDLRVVSGQNIEGGADPEDPEAYRERIWYKKRNPPQGGADADYIQWATAVQPVTDAWVFANYPEANSVSVRVANYNKTPPTLSIGEVADVLEYLTDRHRKPVTADVRVASVQVSTINVAAQIRPNTPTTRSAAEDALRDLLSAQGREKGEPGAPGSSITLSQVQDAISGAAGIVACVVGVVTQDAAPVSTITLSMNHVPALGTATFTTLP